jgi:stage V sporulation protein SpoVS
MRYWRGFFRLTLILCCAAGCGKVEQSTPQKSAAGAAAPASSAPAAPTVSALPASSPDEAAIAAAIERHLQENSGINMSAIDMAIDSISIQGEQAQANITFRLKQGGTTMQMSYFLTRHAKAWLVMRSQTGGGQFAHPPMDKTHSGMAENSQPAGSPNLRRFYKGGSTVTPSAAPTHNSSPQN